MADPLLDELVVYKDVPPERIGEVERLLDGLPPEPEDLEQVMQRFLTRQGYVIGGWIARLIEERISLVEGGGDGDDTSVSTASSLPTSDDHTRAQEALVSGSLIGMIEQPSRGSVTQGHSSGIPDSSAAWDGIGFRGGVGEV